VGSLNVHASLLPRYRGAAPINWALIRGDKVTGVTIQWLRDELDAGPIFLQEQVPITAEDNCATLYTRLAERGAALLGQSLDLLRRGEVIKLPQNEAEVTLAPPISREMRRLHWELTASEVAGWIRGLDPKPGAATQWRGRVLKVFGARVKKREGSWSAPGTVIRLTPQGLEIACGQGSITVKDVQLAGHKRLEAAEFLRGQPLIGQRLE
jgi:methionyl-tRNA formyltransferase